MKIVQKYVSLREIGSPIKGSSVTTRICGSVNWEIDGEGILHLYEGHYKLLGSWYSYLNSIKKIILDEQVVENPDSSTLFSELKN